MYTIADTEYTDWGFTTSPTVFVIFYPVSPQLAPNQGEPPIQTHCII